MKFTHYAGLFVALIFLALMSVQLDTTLALSHQLSLLNAPENAESFADVFFLYAQLPRLCMTLLVGAILGMVGSLMQQLTQNSLTSPLILGTSSGAWLALVIVNIWFIDWIADYSALAAMLGAILAFGLIVMIAGIRNMTGLPLVVSGMVINILLGSIATALVLLNAQFAQNVFIWGAGDLAQYNWDWFNWLLPRSVVAIVILLLAPRILTVLRLGQEGATARGLNVLPAFALLMCMGIWLVSAAITAVGIISFIGLLTPNIARALGARTPRQELFASLILGATLLLITDSLAIALNVWREQTVPSGVTAALIGAPALIWFSRKKVTAQDQVNLSFQQGRTTMPVQILAGLTFAFVAGIFCYVLTTRTGHGWQFSLPGEYQWLLRWPRMVTALSAGIALSIAGTILQRVVHNPLASPDILGVSSGATFAIIIVGLIAGTGLEVFNWGIAFTGSLCVLLVLLWLGRKNQFLPSSFILSGIALTALLEALVQFSLSQGSGDSYKTLLWLTGSTYRVSELQAGMLMLIVAVLTGLVFALSRWLTLISIGQPFTSARGGHAMWINTVLLTLVALLCAVTTATMGPVAFVGLVAPHMAVLLGARKIGQQLLAGALIGATLMLWSDWIGQVVIYPNQIATGTIVAIVGSLYFLCLMLQGRFRY